MTLRSMLVFTISSQFSASYLLLPSVNETLINAFLTEIVNHWYVYTIQKKKKEKEKENYTRVVMKKHLLVFKALMQDIIRLQIDLIRNG